MHDDCLFESGSAEGGQQTVPRIFQTLCEFGERLGFDLSHALASQSELLANLFQRVRLHVFQPKTHSQDGGFASIHRLKHPHHVLQDVRFKQLFFRSFRPIVHDHFT